MQGDLQTIVEYEAQEQPLTVFRVFGRTPKGGGCNYPQNLRGRRVPELQRLDIGNYREIIEMPWRIIHRPDNDRAVVVAIFDTSRDVQRVLFERLMDIPGGNQRGGDASEPVNSRLTVARVSPDVRDKARCAQSRGVWRAK